MPLLKGCSVMVARENMARLKEEGYKYNQSYAISLRIARENMEQCGMRRRRALVRGKLFAKE